MFIKPMKAKKDNHEGVPIGGYVYEVKYDGIRACMTWNGRNLIINSKSGRDITEKFPEIAFNLRLKNHLSRPCILDAELVCFDEKGIPSFSAITSRFHLGSHAGWKQGAIDNPADAVIFDILQVNNGTMIMDRPLDERREYLTETVSGNSPLLISKWYKNGQALYDHEKLRGAEGIIAKRISSTYQPGRRLRDWLKVKIMYEEEVIIYGYIDGKGKRLCQFGSLLFQSLDNWPAGKVGTGFTDYELIEMTQFLATRGAVETKPGTFVLDRPFHAIVKGMRKNKSGAIREPVYVKTV